MYQIFWNLSALFVFPDNNIDDLKPGNTTHAWHSKPKIIISWVKKKELDQSLFLKKKKYSFPLLDPEQDCNILQHFFSSFARVVASK